MSEHTTRILTRLQQLGFHTRTGGLTPFGETLPLVTAVAWDTATAQLAIIAETRDELDPEVWRQLLFAAAGLRHNLAGDGPAALGSPLVLALVDEHQQRALRELAEELATSYILFNRVDLNLIRRDDLDSDQLLDDALAPLLPRCREMAHQEISRADIERFWEVLRGEIRRAAAELDGTFAAYGQRAGEQLAELLIAEDEHAPELPAPVPLQSLAIRNFRSIRDAGITLAPVTIIHGPNGGGKSTLLEALELLWAGTSLRKPDDIQPVEYGRYLPRNGTGKFTVAAEGVEVSDVSEKPRAELARNVLTHETVAALVSQSPEERYTALLTTTGLAMPDLTARAKTLLDQAKRTADDALAKAGLPALPRRDSIAAKHLKEKLTGGFARRIPSTQELAAAEETLQLTSDGAYSPRAWPRDEHAIAALINVDRLAAQQLAQPLSGPAVAAAFDQAREQLAVLSNPRRELLSALRLLQQATTPGPAAPAAQRPTPTRTAPAPLAQDTAIRWLTHARSLRRPRSASARTPPLSATPPGPHGWGSTPRPFVPPPSSPPSTSSRDSPVAPRSRRSYP